MVTKEERRQKLLAAFKEQEKIEKKIKAKAKRQRRRREHPVPKGEKDYKWCDYPTTPHIETTLSGGKTYDEYSNSKKVK